MAAMDEAVARFAQNVAAARRRAGMTQDDLSAESKVHPTEVSRIENAHRDARVSTVAKLARALNVTPGQLLDGLP
jgi:transcriptional regulator with XRE-family HTH domain